MPGMIPEDSSIAELTPKEAVAALERFVINNDELLELEERVGRFNIFDALGVVRQEIRHSNFLAWLLDPAESHGQGQLFLKAILMDLLRETPIENRPLSPIGLDGVDLTGVEVRREWRNIDILIVAHEPAIVIAIENKIDAGEHSNQLARYEKVVRTAFPNHQPMFVFLTPEGDEPSEEDWTTYTYGDIHRVLSRCMRRNESVIGGDVYAFVQHYLNILRGELMDDPVIDDLCRKIYQNHRQAITLISERFGNPRAEIVSSFIDTLRDDEVKWIIESHPNNVLFLPHSWQDWLPAIGEYLPKGRDPRLWLWMILGVGPTWVQMRMYLGPTNDAAPRQRILDRVGKIGSDAGFKTLRANPGGSRATIYSERIATDKSGITAAPEIIKKIETSLARLKGWLPKMETLIRTAIESRDTEEHQS